MRFLFHIYRIVSTVRYLRLQQILWRVKYALCGFSKPAIKNIPEADVTFDIVLEDCDFSSSYLARFRVDSLLKDVVSLLGEEVSFCLGKWNYPEKTHLWNFNLHYFEYAIALGGMYKQTASEIYFQKYKVFLHDWIVSNPMGSGDAWHPYTVSLRLVNLFIANRLFKDRLSKDSQFYTEVHNSLYLQFLWLEKNQEKHLLGNHYFENIKTLYIASVYFQDKKRQKKYKRIVLSILHHQILLDGMHYELSPMYQNILIEGLLRVYACSSDECFKERIRPYLYAMLTAANYMEAGLYRLPFFNDCAERVAKPLSDLNAAAKTLAGYVWNGKDEELAQAGYYRIDSGEYTLLVDCGRIGADEQPGHGHCDALSFELFVAGKPVIVNSGTYQYQSELRPYFRSTQAHNTLVINGHEQSDCWAEHRVGKRIRDVSAQKTQNGLTGRFVNMHGEEHARTFTFSDDVLRIQDSVSVKKTDSVCGYMHIHPDYVCTQTSADEISVSEKIGGKTLFAITFHETESVRIYTDDEHTYYSERFGELQHCTTIAYVWKKDKTSQSVLLKFLK